MGSGFIRIIYVLQSFSCRSDKFDTSRFDCVSVDGEIHSDLCQPLGVLADRNDNGVVHSGIDSVWHRDQFEIQIILLVVWTPDRMIIPCGIADVVWGIPDSITIAILIHVPIPVVPDVVHSGYVVEGVTYRAARVPVVVLPRIYCKRVFHAISSFCKEETVGIDRVVISL